MADTIAAIATGMQLSAIGIIRISGDDTLNIIDKVFVPLSGKPMSRRDDRSLVFGVLKDKQGQAIDHCLCTVSRGPGSYTGEDTAELQCHGSPLVLREGLESLFNAGARQALAGEFTKRGFLNGRMDITQAEAVIDLINAETTQAAVNAAGQVGGAIFRRVNMVYSSLADIASHYHAVLDYPDEDIEEFNLSGYLGTIGDAVSNMQQLLNSFTRGKIMQHGVKGAVVGRPNVGKSSLLNALLGYERVIVTEIAGTTRDTVEVRLRLGGVLIRLSDTAGLRSTSDPVERLGIDRAVKAAREAELVIAVFDGATALTEEDEQVINAAAQAEYKIGVVNKNDLPSRADRSRLERAFGKLYYVSAADMSGLDELEQAVGALFPAGSDASAGEILTNARQAEAVQRALEAMKGAQKAMEDGLTPDAVLSDVEVAMQAIGELTGKVVRDDITSRIFDRFCVGK